MCMRHKLQAPCSLVFEIHEIRAHAKLVKSEMTAPRGGRNWRQKLPHSHSSLAHWKHSKESVFSAKLP